MLKKTLCFLFALILLFCSGCERMPASSSLPQEPETIQLSPLPVPDSPEDYLFVLPTEDGNIVIDYDGKEIMQSKHRLTLLYDGVTGLPQCIVESYFDPYPKNEPRIGSLDFVDIEHTALYDLSGNLLQGWRTGTYGEAFGEWVVLFTATPSEYWHTIQSSLINIYTGKKALNGTAHVSPLQNGTIGVFESSDNSHLLAVFDSNENLLLDLSMLPDGGYNGIYVWENYYIASRPKKGHSKFDEYMLFDKQLNPVFSTHHDQMYAFGKKLVVANLMPQIDTAVYRNSVSVYCADSWAEVYSNPNVSRIDYIDEGSVVLRYAWGSKKKFTLYSFETEQESKAYTYLEKLDTLSYAGFPCYIAGSESEAYILNHLGEELYSTNSVSNILGFYEYAAGQFYYFSDDLEEECFFNEKLEVLPYPANTNLLFGCFNGKKWTTDIPLLSIDDKDDPLLPFSICNTNGDVIMEDVAWVARGYRNRILLSTSEYVGLIDLQGKWIYKTPAPPQD